MSPCIPIRNRTLIGHFQLENQSIRLQTTPNRLGRVSGNPAWNEYGVNDRLVELQKLSIIRALFLTTVLTVVCINRNAVEVVCMITNLSETTNIDLLPTTKNLHLIDLKRKTVEKDWQAMNSDQRTTMVVTVAKSSKPGAHFPLSVNTCQTTEKTRFPLQQRERILTTKISKG